MTVENTHKGAKHNCACVSDCPRVQASRAAQAVLGRLVAEATEAAAAAAAAGSNTGPSYGMGYGMGYGTPYGMAPAAGALAGSSLTSYGSGDTAAALETYYRGLLALVDGRAAALQGLINKVRAVLTRGLCCVTLCWAWYRAPCSGGAVSGMRGC